MPRRTDLEEAVFSHLKSDDFDALALEIYRFQYTHNSVYRRWADYLGRSPLQVSKLSQIPFLPIELFKNFAVVCGEEQHLPPLVFESSGTTGSVPSKHYVAYPEVYSRSFIEGFKHFYGDPAGWRILALLPSYLERIGSSLVYMADELISLSKNTDSGFFLNNLGGLADLLQKPSETPTLVIGVSFALLELAEAYPIGLNNTVIMETGGMKGRRKELTRDELHTVLCKAFAVSEIHSEYGMTELLSQAYAQKGGLFKTPPWMRLLLRDMNDPLTTAADGKTGGINIIDLANLYSCSFIASSDLGRQPSALTTEVLGRFDYSDVRGCNLMVGDL